MKDNVVVDKSYAFSLKVIRIYKKLCQVNKEYVLSKQVLRSGTAIGANVEEAVGAQSAKDFISKLAIAYKEARETHYWLRLLRDSEYLTPHEAAPLIQDCDELVRIIGSIGRTMKERESQIRNS